MLSERVLGSHPRKFSKTSDSINMDDTGKIITLQHNKMEVTSHAEGYRKKITNSCIYK